VVAGPGGDPASGPGNSAEPSLAALATAASGIPAIQLPRVADVPTIAALFTAGALKELSPLIVNPISKDTSYPVDAQSSWIVPPARNGMADDGAAGNGAHSQNGAGREATAHSADRP
jgi:hypothetical protein